MARPGKAWDSGWTAYTGVRVPGTHAGRGSAWHGGSWQCMVRPGWAGQGMGGDYFPHKLIAAPVTVPPVHVHDTCPQAGKQK